MRTTLEIDDDVIQHARELARLKNHGVGKAISELARRGLKLDDEPKLAFEHGIPVWQHAPGAVPVTSELVRNLSDDE